MNKKILLISIMTVFMMMMLPSVSAVQFNTDAETKSQSLNDGGVSISIRGGIGLHIRVVNNKGTSILVSYSIKTSSVDIEGSGIVGPGLSWGASYYGVGFFKSITASVTADGQTTTRTGFIIIIFVII